MSRMARLVVPGYPHHVTQRGNRSQTVFFGDDDYAAYRDMLAHFTAKAGTAVWAYCLMPNHVHLILVPEDADGLRAALGETHRRYARRINEREGWQGHLWQERFHSFPMDGAHLIHCARYIALNPVKAGLAKRAHDWPWSSAKAHRAGRDDELVSVAPLLKRVGDWRRFVGDRMPGKLAEEVERHIATGRPLGDEDWLKRLEKRLGRSLRPGRPGRPRKRAEGGDGR